MRIELFESDYPVADLVKDLEEPEQKVGYFDCEDTELEKIIPGENAKLNGTFVYDNSMNAPRPRPADHYLAKFHYKGQGVIHQATLIYEAFSDRGKNEWPASLTLTKVIDTF